ncbi:restriction endonuclease subunit S [Marinomonas piezotolerans]|uniref:Restriction endonuclease subunit S n=1 Tax=Marinomonas piezotolerans TaxID=2213058 RepID=A0A370U7N2_9GAMM|nr:restriction endonuclease subunit S [Marinomonas piezotolerans]RDL43799.1 restriction endonuclease subunit S [Marinomonas piezotolerans]
MSCEWPLVSLADVTSKIGDGLHGTPKYEDNGEYFFINGNNLSNGSIIINESTKRASEEEYLKHKKDLNHRTILVSINGTLGNIGTYQGEKVFLGKSACYLNILPEVDKDFIRYVLTGHDFQNYIHNLATGSTIKNVGLKLMREYEFKLPDHKTQKSISTVLNSFDLKINTNTNINQTLEAMAQTIFKSWFVDFDPVKAKMNGERPVGMDEATAALFPDKLVESELGLIPEGWAVSNLSSLIQLTGGGTPKRSEETYWNGDIPWFSVKDVPTGSNVFVVDTEEKITEFGLQKSSTKLLPKGTTIITARGTVGKLALLGTDMCMNQSCYGIKGKEVGDYFNYFNLKEAVSTLQQNTHGAVFDTITTKTFDTYVTAFSGVPLANKFDAIVSPLLQKIENNVRENIELSKLRNTLLPKLLSGEISLANDMDS